MLIAIHASGNEVAEEKTLKLVIEDELGLLFQADVGIKWAIKNGYFISREICKMHGVTEGADGHPGNTLSSVTKPTTAKINDVPFTSPSGSETTNAPAADVKPWEIVDPKDPLPEQHWYTPARYFARQLIRDDTTLLTKREILADKVVQSLTGAGIKKRGGEKRFSSGTILKAFSNVSLG